MSQPPIGKVHFWCASLCEQGGGIEAYARDFLRVLSGEVGAVKVFSKNDSVAALQRHLPADMIGAGFGGVPNRVRTLPFTAMIALRAAIDRPDLILCMHVNFTPVAAGLKKRLGIPYILPLYGMEVWNLHHPGRRRGLAQADLLLSISDFTSERVRREQQLPPDRFRLLPCTFNAERFSIGARPSHLADRYGLPADASVILSVGRLAASEAYKGQDRVIRALPTIRQQAPHVRYLIAGDGDDKPRLQRIAAEQGVADAVIFAGRVPDAELADHYRLCDLFAMPSTGEGFGIVYLEALACGKPPLGGNKDAAVDALCGGELGVLVDPENPAELAAKITQALQGRHDNPLLRQPEALRARMIEHFSFDRFKSTLSEHLSKWARNHWASIGKSEP